jgi:SAM-dependent methyltransferase
VTPSELCHGHTAAFLADALRGRRRVLEVGCGEGTVARALGSAGFLVTALDRELRDPRPSPNVTFVQRDFLAFTAEPFDAVVFTSSLHHIAALDDAISHAVDLLVLEGLLIADEFDFERPDVTTLQWYYDTQELLTAAGVYKHEHLDKPNRDLLARWRDAHSHDPPLHTGVAMRSAIATLLSVVEIRACEYLYRYICSGLPADDRGGAVAAHVLGTEQRRIADGSLAAVGLRVIAARS